MDHLDYLPQSNRLAARLGRFDRERVEWLKGFLPPGRTYGPNEKAWLFGIEHAAWAVGHLLREGFEPTAAFQRRFPELLQAPTLGDPDVVREPSPDPYGEPVAGPQPAPMPPTGLSVEGLLQGLERAVHAAFPDRVWVAACLGGLRRQATKGYMTADLVDVDEAGQPGAKLACYISREALARIDMRLAKEGLALAELLPVLVRGRLEVRFGRVQLQLEDLDPAYTVGKTRLSLEQAFAQLDREGLARLQLALPWPELPLRVGLVAGADGEGTRDFRRTLEESGLPFVLRLEAVRMQGEGLEAALVGALGRLAALEVDVIAIVRGGGAGADLHGFNAPGLARAVCTCRRPVLIGIGHDHDRTLLDMVARSQRTPTAAGRHLVDTVAAAVRARELRLRDAFGRLAARLSADRARVEAADRALEAVPGRLERRGEALAATRARVEHRWRAVAAEASRQLDVGATQLRAVPERLRTEGLRLEGAARDLARAPGVRLQRDRRALDARAEGLARLATRRMEAARLTLARRPVLLEGRATLLTERAAQGIALRAERLAARDPARLLARGYALVTRPGGGLVRGAGELAAGEALRLRMADGTVDVRVEQAREDQGGG